MLLVCNPVLSAAFGDPPDLAVLDLDRELAAHLIQLRKVRQAAVDAAAPLGAGRPYAVEFFIAPRVLYKDGLFLEELGDGDDYETWGVVVDGVVPDVDDWRVAVPTLKLLDTGVLWTAQHPAGGELETSELSWNDIQTIADGGDPDLPKVAVLSRRDLPVAESDGD